MTSQVQQVKERIDLVPLIAERVKLTKTGNNYKGLCPFHSEKTPSFFVNPEMQRYICFGCHENGDCFTFLQKYDTMTFSEALQFLAKRVGIELSEVHTTGEEQKREKLLRVLSLAKEFFHYVLTSHPAGEMARLYLKERGITDETIQTFGIGVSLSSWDGLMKYLIKKKGFNEQELLDAGVTIRSAKGTIYDRFRDRLMFPLTNSRGHVVGFSGRLLDKNTKEAKYINSSETMLYHKSELLFGYSQLHRFISEKDEALLVEGEFDVLSSYQAHVKNVVAIKGSALSQSQLKLLSRIAKRLTLSLDNDKAGVEATKRAIVLAREFDLGLRVLVLAGGKDPDEIAKENPKIWREMVKKSISVYDYLINVSFDTHDSTGGEGKREITNELAPLIEGISNAVEQAHYIQRIAKRLGVKEEVFLTEVRRHTFGVKPSFSAKVPDEIPEKKMRTELLEEYLLSILFHMPSIEVVIHIPELEGRIISPSYKRLLSIAKELGREFSIPSFLRLMPEELKGLFSSLYMRNDEGISESINLEEEYQKAFKDLEGINQRQLRTQIAKRITELENKTELANDEEEELSKLIMMMKPSA